MMFHFGIPASAPLIGGHVLQIPQAAPVPQLSTLTNAFAMQIQGPAQASVQGLSLLPLRQPGPKDWSPRTGICRCKKGNPPCP